MSRRTSIINAITTQLLLINGTAPYKTNIFQNAYPKLKFWDEVEDFPCIYLTPGTELREYHPADFTWGFLGVAVKVYCHGEYSSSQLETLLGDIETCIDLNRQVIYDSINKYSTTEILIQSITTDEGLLAPYAVGEINLQVRYQIM
jgi:hypothetical protein